MISTRSLFYKRKVTLKGKTVQEGWGGVGLGMKFGMLSYGKCGCTRSFVSADFKGADIGGREKYDKQAQTQEKKTQAL